MKNKTLHITVIGGGGTGAALAHDLTLRGLQVTLFERGELTPEDEEYCTPFLDGCSAAGIPAKLLRASDALRMEPGINPKVRLAVQVPEGTMDAFRLPLHFFAAAKKNGASIRTFAEVTGIEVRGRAVAGVKVLDHLSGREVSLGADMVINAAGPWAGKVASRSARRRGPWWRSRAGSPTWS